MLPGNGVWVAVEVGVGVLVGSGVVVFVGGNGVEVAEGRISFVWVGSSVGLIVIGGLTSVVGFIVEPDVAQPTNIIEKMSISSSFINIII